MNDRFNTIAGWTLFAGVVALGFSSVSAKFFEADKHHRPHEMGYAIEGVEADHALIEVAQHHPQALADKCMVVGYQDIHRRRTVRRIEGADYLRPAARFA